MSQPPALSRASHPVVVSEQARRAASFQLRIADTITAFAVTIALGTFYPAMLIGLCFCAISVALSRIVLGMHFLSDVIAGAAIGGLLGYASAAIFHL